MSIAHASVYVNHFFCFFHEAFCENEHKQVKYGNEIRLHFKLQQYKLSSNHRGEASDIPEDGKNIAGSLCRKAPASREGAKAEQEDQLPGFCLRFPFCETLVFLFVKRSLTKTGILL